MTNWNNNTKLANHTDMVKVVLTGKEHSVRFTRGYGSFRKRRFVKGPQQCFNCQKCGHHARTCRSGIHTCRYCQEDITLTNARTANNSHSNVQTADRSTPLQVVPPQREWKMRIKQRPHQHHNEPTKTGKAGNQLPYYWLTHGPHWRYRKWRSGPFHANHQFS